MNRQNDGQPDALERRVAALPRDIEPPRDFWPEIAARFAPRDGIAGDRRRRVSWVPVAVALAAGYALASVFPLPWLAPGGRIDLELAAPDIALVDSVRPALEQLPAKTRAVVETNLSGLEHDQQAIEQALAADPDNVLLQELRTSAYDRAVSVVEQMRRLTQPEPPEDVEI